MKVQQAAVSMPVIVFFIIMVTIYSDACSCQVIVSVNIFPF